MLKPNLPSFPDAGGAALPDGLPAVADAHVHVFPEKIFAAVQRWFDDHAWHIRYRLSTSGIFDFLLSRGVTHIVALQYAHKPGIARRLNRYMARKCAAYPGRVTGLATVFPGEDDGPAILQEAFDLGLGGMKLHAHVQCFDMNAACLAPLYACCRDNAKPVVMHVGREPKSEAYRCDPYQICSAAKLERVLREYPGLAVCVPHLGFDELADYRRLMQRYDSLWLDTTMLLADYFPVGERIDLAGYPAERLMYGSDFPNIPYAWDRELKHLAASGLPVDLLEGLLYRNAARFFGFLECI
jgi:predicted TIM-barrel fold metal-dependent hydrolase